MKTSKKVKWNKWLIVGLGLCMGVTICGRGRAVPTPRDTVQELLDSVKILSQSPKGNPDPAVMKRISHMMDIAGVSKACLGPHWGKLPPKEQQAFIRLFQDVLEKVAYPKSAKFFKETTIDIGDMSAQTASAHVLTQVTHPKEGMVEVDYQLKLVNGKWLIEDVVLDGVSLVEDLRSQIQKIIKEKSYEELKRKLNEKLKEETAS
jgi:phospholipid transport system substrate-binding protein